MPCAAELTIGAETAQLLERPTEEPGAILTRVRVPGAASFVFLSLSQLPP